MKQSATPKGVCSTHIEFEIEDGLVHGVRFQDGCHGNLQGLARLAEGRPAEELVALLSGIRCGKKKTSCPDQLARAVKKAAATCAKA